jgi:hypothetical protein
MSMTQPNLMTRWQRVKWTLAHDLNPKAVVRWVPIMLADEAKYRSRVLVAAIFDAVWYPIIALFCLLLFVPVIVLAPVLSVIGGVKHAYKGGAYWDFAYTIVTGEKPEPSNPIL